MVSMGNISDQRNRSDFLKWAARYYNEMKIWREETVKFKDNPETHIKWRTVKILAEGLSKWERIALGSIERGF
jgi:hypothetical protein